MGENLVEVRLADALPHISDSYYAKFLSFQPDEKVWFRHSLLRDSAYLDERDTERLRLKDHPDDDPDVIAFIRRDSDETMLFCIANWTLLGPDGKPLLVPSLTNREPWDKLSRLVQGFLKWLRVAVEDETYPARDKLADDPKGAGGGKRSASTGLSSDATKATN